MKTISTILTIVTISASLFFFAPSEHTIQKDMTVHNNSTVNQLVLDAAKEQGINLDSVDLNESRDITIHESGVDAGNLKPGSTVKVTVVYRK